MADSAPNETATPPVDEFRAGVRKALALADDADDTAVLSALGTVTTQRDEAVANAEKITTERNAEKIDAAVALALGKSGIIAQNADDAAAIIKAALEVNKDGRVVTKTAPNVVPGQTPEQFIAGQLKTMRPHYWPLSAGGGVTGGGVPVFGVNVDCFKPGGRLTDQYALVSSLGEKAVIEGCRRAGIVPPAWLTGGKR